MLNLRNFVPLKKFNGGRFIKNIFKALAQDCICPKNFPVCVCGHKAEIKILGKAKVATADELNLETSYCRKNLNGGRFIKILSKAKVATADELKLETSYC